MAVSTTLSFGDVHSFNLDPMNPRLGRRRMSRDAPQETVLEWLAAWKLEELAYSFIESGGFWTYEPLIVVQEPLYRKKRALIVVGGNRRLAALIYLRNSVEGKPSSRKWSEMLEGAEVPENIFSRIPYFLADARADIQAFLGFEHVTGIKQWDADEKAGYIVHLVDYACLSYEQVARLIGTTAPAARRHYIAFQILKQMESTVDTFPHGKAEHRF